tara:strand:- start:211 stop:375 length:165 start_codon:yes stop_codon:yes gene_type:complete
VLSEEVFINEATIAVIKTKTAIKAGVAEIELKIKKAIIAKIAAITIVDILGEFI